MKWISHSGGAILADGNNIYAVILKHKGDVFDSEGHHTYYHWYLTGSDDMGVIVGYYPGKAKRAAERALAERD